MQMKMMMLCVQSVGLIMLVKLIRRKKLGLDVKDGVDNGFIINV
jgi:hypothetical protein